MAERWRNHRRLPGNVTSPEARGIDVQLRHRWDLTRFTVRRPAKSRRRELISFCRETRSLSERPLPNGRGSDAKSRTVNDAIGAPTVREGLLRRRTAVSRQKLIRRCGQKRFRLGPFAPEAKQAQLSCLFPARFDRLKRLFAAHSAPIVGVIVGVAGGASAGGLRCDARVLLDARTDLCVAGPGFSLIPPFIRSP